VRRGGALAGLAVGIGLVTVVGGCSESPPASPEAVRGGQIYSGRCTACHNPDPARPGSVGPPVKGSSRELLEAKLLRGTYPPGYPPKRTTGIMPVQPLSGDEIIALAAFLR
jgi:mono/diheme cytochrome c family protein